MIKTEHVKIEIPPAERKSPNPPLKIRKPRSMPTGGRFKFVPKQMPHLAEYVKSVKWSSDSKRILLEIAETPAFDVYTWIEYIDKRQKEIQKGPFVNLNEDLISLHFLDENDQEIAQVKLINISLARHCCKLNAEGSKDKPLRHQIVLGYQEEKLILPPPEETEPDQFNNNVADEEWTEVEVVEKG